jgi:toxin HigB-1
VKIRSFTHKGMKRLYEEDDVRGIEPATVDKLRKMLLFLDEMEDAKELRALPAWKAHTLTGNRKGTWSLSVVRCESPRQSPLRDAASPLRSRPRSSRGPGLGAAVANDHAAGVLQLFFGGADGGGDGGDGSSGFFSRTFTLTMTCGKTFRSAVSSSMDLPVRAIRSRTTSAVSRPSPVVAR